MYDHIGIHVTDLAASAVFYKAVLAPLGHVLNSSDDSGAGLGPEGASSLWLYPRKGAKGADGKGGGSHIAFAAPDRRSVDRFHAAGLKAGGRDNGGAGLRVDYSPTYYAAFLIDPDGNNVEAVCMAE